MPTQHVVCLLSPFAKLRRRRGNPILRWRKRRRERQRLIEAEADLKTQHELAKTLNQMDEASFQLFCKGKLRSQRLGIQTSRCPKRKIRHGAPKPVPEPVPEPQSSVPDTLSVDEALLRNKLQGWLDIGASLASACDLAGVSESTIAALVAEARTRNGDFRAFVLSLVSVPWHHCGNDGRPVMYDPGIVTREYVAHSASEWKELNSTAKAVAGLYQNKLRQSS
jgi:hypothetical protein